MGKTKRDERLSPAEAWKIFCEIDLERRAGELEDGKEKLSKAHENARSCRVEYDKFFNSENINIANITNIRKIIESSLKEVDNHKKAIEQFVESLGGESF